MGANPITVPCAADVWVKVATAITSIFITKKSNNPGLYLQSVVVSGGVAPSDDTLATLIFSESDLSPISTSEEVDVYIKAVGGDGSVLTEDLKSAPSAPSGKTDPLTGFQAVTSASHVERHDGEMWVCSSEYVGGAIGSHKLFLFTAGPLKSAHITWKMSGDEKFFFRAYADPTVTLAGTLAGTPRNADLGIGGAPTSVITEDPTITANGDRIDFDFTDKAVIVRDNEFIVPPNGQVLFDMEMIKAAMIGGETVEWYEV